MTRMVCCMYYTDVFVGIVNNIDNLKNALMAELPDSELTDELTQLVHGLCLFMGYPSCVCKPKKSVEESLKKISEELKEELNFYKCLNSKPSLNCSSCLNSDVVCKCCVLDCILKVQGSSCQCVKGNNNNCSCSDVEPKRCCKDLLEKLKASLSLLNLKADMESLCQCNASDCCVNGKCTKAPSGCTVCPTSKPSNDYTVTGLGLLRPSPKRLAEKLDKFFGTGSSKSSSVCTCKCGSGQGVSCCCLACPGNCSQACSAGCGSKGCSSHKTPQNCPCKEFCKQIDNIKIASDSGVMKCCNEGKSCHCQVGGSPPCSGQNCCDQKKKVKCLIRRLVSYFKSLKFTPDAQIKNFKNCCELLCVVKTCEFLRDFYNKRNAKECNTCKKKGAQGKCPKGSGQCCNGTISKCNSGSCQNCSECQQICDSKKFYRELQTLQYSGPCGQDLYRALDDFLYYCCNVFWPYVNKKEVKGKIEDARKKCQCTPGNCKCSTQGSSCQGCTAVLSELKKLQAHKDVLGLMTRGYSSAYSSASAKWNLLCSSSKPCSGCRNSPPYCPCQSAFSFSTCSDGSCCENCDVKKAAKIFLGFLPCLYYGLKILYDRSKYDSGFAGWNLAKIPEASGLKDFLFAWGFDLNPLKSKNASDLPPILDILYGSGKFKSLLDLVSQKYFTSSSSGSQDPSTVRDMLLWLYGLRFQKHFSELVENCKSLCLPLDNAFHPDAVCYYLHVSCFILPVSFISTVQHSDSHVSTFFPDADSEFLQFSYPEDLSSLFEKLCEYVRKIFVALNFLYYQCKNDRNSAGWHDCAFGRQCADALKSSPATSASSSGSSSGSCSSCKYSGAYLCTAINKDPVHDHCQKGSCLGFSASCSGSSAHPQSKGQACTPCPHPLQRFLIDGSSDSDSQPENSKNLKNFRTPFHSSTVTPMGFKTEHLPEKARQGKDLYHALKVFCESGFDPLTRLVQFILCVSRYPPETLGEFFAFFKKFAEALKSDPLGKKFAQWIDGEPGFYCGSALKTALENLYGSHSGDHSPANLYSLHGCHPKKDSDATCGKYLYPLTYNAYNNNIFIDDFLDTYLSWVCYSAEKFKEKLKEFHTEFSDCCSSGSSCTKIVHCPCALPFLYSNGFQFNSPKTLNSGKKCSDFIAQLRFVIWGKPFKALLEEIPKFIWSIREPFFLFVLAFWAFVISYFLYVQLYKLDLLHLKSHAHFSRSFKILPSTLFSDASSKLKDLSYFSL
ncbi:variant erythrocyte surface antigen-1 family protein [Babesia divergens]|uniref:Variant erythrocyte surface antigen-1 family protein n=1 Tax=Babesia divergens TaxID=32595 RepID=A0AAD9GGA6_BABDI|nr:variant erythrocyte surface antigen-1 family protein [Babesia divergens]